MLLENYRPGVIAAMGYGWESVHERFPHLIMCSVSGFGQTGPDSGKPAMDVVVQALSGVMSITGFEDRPGVGCGAAIADVSAGMMAANGIMASYIGRQATGVGNLVDVSMLDVMVMQMARQLSRFSNGTLDQPVRAGSASPTAAPFDTYKTADGEIALIGLNPNHWDLICDVLGDDAIRDDPRYDTRHNRRNHYDDFKPQLESLLSERTALEWSELFGAAGVPCAPVNDLQGVLDMPQLEARNMFPTTPDGQTVVGTPVKLSNVPDPTVVAPEFGKGEHTERVLGALGLGASKL